MFHIGDYVTRKKYNNDIIFKIKEIINNKVILTGCEIRLYADADIDDLVLTSIRKEKDSYEIKKLDNKYFYMPGIILHLDSDEDYLNKCKKYYEANHLRSYCILLKEKEYIDNIEELINKYNPTIIVLTGHDAYYKNNNNYKNSKYFIKTVKYIRSNLNKKEIVIVAGACQSDFINLIKNGSNFASSPSHINIHALDPAIIASYVALYDKNKTIELNEILNKTTYGPDGIGGINTNGVMIVGYPRKE